MTTSQSTSMLAKPAGNDAVPLGTLAYFRARNRGRVHDAVLREFKRSGISRATLARRLGKRPEVITRLLGGAGNWTLDTVSDVLFAISGAEPNYTLVHPLEEPPRNMRTPDWLNALPSTQRNKPSEAGEKQGATIGMTTAAPTGAAAVASAYSQGRILTAALP